jgi:amino acid adenylation domain-containing protein
MLGKDIEDSYPLSPIQKGMLFHSHYAQQSGVDIEQMVCGLHEELNVPAFRQAWDSVVARHSALRTSFCWEGLDEPKQEVHRSVSVPFEEQDWRGLLSAQQKVRLEAYLRSDRKRGFTLARAPLIRLALFRFAEADYQFIWTFHHILADGRSHLLILKEVFGFYEAFAWHKDFQPEPARLYGNYIRWLQQQDLSKAELFWRRLLKGFSEPISLNLPPSRATAPEDVRGEQEGRLSAAATSQLKSLAQEHCLTLNIFVQGAWALLLSHYSGEADIVFGAVRGGRPSMVAGAESMVGMFINTLPVRARIFPDQPLLAWLEDLRAQSIAVREYEHTPLVMVQGWHGRLSGTPLFETILVFNKYLLHSALTAEGGNSERREFRLVEKTNFPLTLYAYGESALLLKIAYDRCRFDDAIVSSMLDNLRAILEGIALDPHRQLADVPYLSPAEEHKLIAQWNETQTDFPATLCIHQLFEDQAARTPDAVAVVFEDKQLTYSELNSRANQLARRLHSLGVGPDVLVGIAVERSLEMVIGLLAIIKAGGAYVPLDPAFPEERLAFMMEDSQLKVVVTQGNLLRYLPAHDGQTICLDSDWSTISQESRENPSRKLDPETRAYVIYTSGSTGKPKGVEISHRAVVNFLSSMREQPGISEQDVLLAVTTISFDIAGLELYLPLVVGGRVVIASREVAMDGVRLSQLITDSQATVMQATPATWRMLIASGWEGSKRLKILCGGEGLPDKLANQLLERGYSLWNMYGPTETTIWSTIQEVKSGQGSISIGRPIANTEIYILDGHMQPVPFGVPGELHIGGAGLARGYFNRPELTEERFIRHPFSADSKARLYKTGDLARYRSDGNIECLGRLDHQVKIRGFRIELGEIEAVTREHPNISDAVVVAREDNPGERRLVAYIVASGDAAPGTSDIRAFLQRKLPDYMIPSVFVSLEALPLTPNGKIDRKLLPAPERTPLQQTGYVAPRTASDEILAGIWAEVLGLERAGIKDNFFEVGGNSFLAVKLLSEIYKTFGKQLPLATLFNAQTVEELAKVLRDDTYLVSGSTLVALQPTGRRPPFYCVHPGGGGVLYYRELALYLGPDQPFFGLQAQGLDGKSVDAVRIEDMAAIYIKEIQTVQPEGPYFLGGLCFGGLAAFEMAQQLSRQGHEVALLALIDTYAPGDVSLLPKAFSFTTKMRRAIQRVDIESQALILLNPKEQFDYVVEKTKRVTGRMSKKFKRTISKLLGEVRHPLPYALRKVQENNDEAARLYAPQIYEGPVTLFRASNQPAGWQYKPDLGWGKLVSGSLEIHEIVGYHESIATGPTARRLAEKLRGCLDKSQTKLTAGEGRSSLNSYPAAEITS